MISWRIFFVGIVTILSQTGHVKSHGRLILPAQRSSAWRYGFDNPVNYNDNELFCGGFSVQWYKNGGRCGVCGDRFDAEVKPNEDIKGKYVKNGVITGSYLRGSVMTTKVELTAYHKGWFEFRLCPLATFTTKVTQACLNKTLLRVAGTNTTRIMLDGIKVGMGVGVYKIDLQLPSAITCDRCVLQWKYNTGNSDGCDSSGCCIGCGRQENFVNCADVRIVDTQTGTTLPESSSSATQTDTMTAFTSSTSSTTQQSSSPSSSIAPAPVTTANQVLDQMCTLLRICKATELSSIYSGMTKWCCDNCLRGFCPPSFCDCSFDYGNI